MLRYALGYEQFKRGTAMLSDQTQAFLLTTLEAMADAVEAEANA